jgi:GH35 family endo-1,4-beta-xylanase
MTGMHFNNVPAKLPKTSWVRLWDCGVTWKDIHKGPNSYDWSRLDYLVDLYSDRKILYVFASTPQWLALNPNQGHFAPWLGPGSNSLPKDIEEWNKFVWNVTTRYKGRIHGYQIWNEPQLVDFMYPWNSSSLNRLGTMTVRANRTIKSIDKNAKVVSAAVLPRPSSGGVKRGSRYLNVLRKNGWPVDVIACHIYPEINTRAVRWAAMLEEVKNVVQKMRGPKHVWVTETNYNLLGPVVPEAVARGLITQTYARAKSSLIFWYGWDSTSWLGGLDINHNTGAWEAIKDKIK